MIFSYRLITVFPENIVILKTYQLLNYRQNANSNDSFEHHRLLYFILLFLGKRINLNDIYLSSRTPSTVAAYANSLCPHIAFDSLGLKLFYTRVIVLQKKEYVC